MTQNEAEEEEKKEEIKQLKTGERFWVWSAEPPSDFEISVATMLERADKETEIFYLYIFSWANYDTRSEILSTSYFPNEIHLPQERSICFYKVEKPQSVKIMVPQLTFSNIAKGGDIRYRSEEYSFEDQLLAIISCRQIDHDLENTSLKGAMDAIGFLSLLIGDSMLSRPVISSYFNIKNKKFLSGDLIVSKSSNIDNLMIEMKDVYHTEKFIGEDQKIHAALWFAGKAFVEAGMGSKIVFYDIALEIISDRNKQNYFRKLYRGKAVQDHAVNVVRELQNLRGDLVHYGIPRELPKKTERYLQLILLDALIRQQTGSLRGSAFAKAKEIFHA